MRLRLWDSLPACAGKMPTPHQEKKISHNCNGIVINNKNIKGKSMKTRLAPITLTPLGF
jgi:hypothetical protein